MSTDAPDPIVQAAEEELDALVVRLHAAGISVSDLGVLLIATGIGVFIGSLCHQHQLEELHALRQWIDKRIVEIRNEMN